MKTGASLMLLALTHPIAVGHTDGLDSLHQTSVFKMVADAMREFNPLQFRYRYAVWDTLSRFAANVMTGRLRCAVQRLSTVYM